MFKLQNENRQISVGVITTILDAFFDLIVIVDLQGTVCYISPSVERVLGHMPDELIRKHIQDVICTENSDSFMDLLKISGHKLQRARCRCKHKDGRSLFAEIVVKIIHVASIKFVVIAFLNISESASVEQMAMVAETWYKLLVENSRDGIYRSTPEGQYVDVNDALVEMLGYSNKKELLAIDIRKDLYVHETMRPSANQRDTVFTTQLKRKDGTYIWAEINSHVLNDEHGKPKYYQGIVRDITRRKQAKERIEYLNSILNVIRSINQLIVREQNMDKMLRKAVSILMNARNYTMAWIGKVAGNDKLQLLAHANSDYGYLQAMLDDERNRDCPAFRVVKEKRTFFVKRIGSSSYFPQGMKEAALKQGYMSSVSVPIISQNEIFGVLEVFSTGENSFDSQEISLLEEVATDVGFAIAQIQAEERSRYLSFHDSLTGLYNRAYFEEEMKRLDKERQLPISIIMGDVNGLKLTNDALGHSAGDEVLKQTAKVLKRACRAEDIIARWGGDEFVILLPHAPEHVAKKVCARISEVYRDVKVGPVGLTIALGYATKTEPSQELKAILDKAENWLYRRKLLEGKSQRSDIINSLDTALREKSHETEEHVKRITDLAIQIGKVLRLSDNDLNSLELLARLHDIGKIGVPDFILNKAGELCEDEWKLLKKHSEIGYRIAIALPDLAPIGESILAHHERWDGKGYPRGLKEEEIPLLARIIAVVDAYDVMTSGRPYMPPISRQKALAEIRVNSAKQFDPRIVDAFLKMKEAAFATN